MVGMVYNKENPTLKKIFGKEQIDMPSKSTLHRILTNTDNNELEKVFRKHFSKYVKKENIDLNNSIENTHETVGYAVMTTSLTIAFGFSVLGLSNFISTILFGLFTALAMIIAMFGVLITLPSSLIRFKL